MAHFIDTETHEITDNVLVDSRPRFAEFKPDGSEVWVGAEIGGTVSVIDVQDEGGRLKKITFEIPGLRAEAIQPVGVQDHRRWQEGLRGARAGQPRGGGQHGETTRWKNTCWSGSASGSWPSRRTRRH